MNYQALFHSMGLTTEKFLLLSVGVGFILCFVLLIWNISQQSKIKKLRNSYDSLMRGKEDLNLEELIQTKFDDVEKVQNALAEHEQRLETLKEELRYGFCKSGLVRYDAFDVMAGKLSFALVLLNQDNNGYLLNVIHSREGCYVYTKEIVNGESNIELSQEEKQAINLAVDKRSL